MLLFACKWLRALIRERETTSSFVFEGLSAGILVDSEIDL